MLKITQLTKIYGSAVALREVSVELASGQTHILLGSSGSGKSTLLKAILNLIRCDSGAIELDGQSISKLSSEARSLQIGYVPQGAGLFPHLTARDNITLVARSLKWQANRLQKRLEELNTIIQVDKTLFERFPSQLSGGQQQRIALFRALFLDPTVILLDEPFSALDPLVRADIQVEVRSLFQELKKTVVFVTHDVSEASILGDNILLFHQGVIVQQGKLNQLMNHPSTPFVTRFLKAQIPFQYSTENL